MCSQRFSRRIACVGSVLTLLVATGCQSNTLTGESKLAGAWTLVEGTREATYQGRHEKTELPPWTKDRPYVVIKPDGTFYLMEGQGATMFDALRHRGNRVEASWGFMTVERSSYTPVSSELHLRGYAKNEKMDNRMSFEARLRLDGKLSYRQKKPFWGVAEELVTATLERMEGRRPWDPPGLVREFQGHRGGAFCVEFSPDGRYLLSGGSDNTLRLWDVETGAQIRSMKGHEARVVDVAFSPDGRLVASASYDPIGSKPGDSYPLRIWNPETGHQTVQIKAHRALTSVQFSPDGRTVLASGYPSGAELEQDDGGEPGYSTAWIWNVETGELSAGLRHIESIMSAVFLPDGQSVLCATHGSRSSSNVDKGFETVKSLGVGMLCLYDTEERAMERCFGQPIWHNYISGLEMLSLSPNAGRVLTVGQAKYIQEWDLESGEERRRIEVAAHHATRAIYLPDDRRALIGDSEGEICLWDLEQEARLHCFDGHRDTVTDLAVSPDGRQAASCSIDGTIRLWRLPE